MKQIERKMVIKGETKTDNMKRIYRVGTSRYSQVIKFGFAKVIDETPKFYKIVHGKGLFAHQDKIDKSLVQATNANEIVSKGISVFRKRIEQLTQEIKEAEEHIDFLKTILGKTEDEIKNALDAKFSSLN
jgi:peptidoglycan hydrolase CwlO-like protein